MTTAAFVALLLTSQAQPVPAADAIPAPHVRARLRAGVRMIDDNDYPAPALRARQQGPVGFRLTISPAGIVSGCEIIASSGSPSLDETGSFPGPELTGAAYGSCVGMVWRTFQERARRSMRGIDPGAGMGRSGCGTRRDR